MSTTNCFLILASYPPHLFPTTQPFLGELFLFFFFLQSPPSDPSFPSLRHAVGTFKVHLSSSPAYSVPWLAFPYSFPSRLFSPSFSSFFFCKEKSGLDTPPQVASFQRLSVAPVPPTVFSDFPFLFPFPFPQEPPLLRGFPILPHFSSPEVIPYPLFLFK